MSSQAVFSTELCFMHLSPSVASIYLHRVHRFHSIVALSCSTPLHRERVELYLVGHSGDSLGVSTP